MRVIILMGMLFSISLSMAQKVTVLDKTTFDPIEFVQIGSKGAQHVAITNAKGEADVSAFKGLNDIIFKLYGYEPKEVNYETLKANDFKIELTASVFMMNEVVISANKWSQISSDVPYKVSSLSPKDIALQNPQTAADLLGTSGDVFIQKSQQGGGSPMIRGFATNRLLYTIDGVRMNTAIFRGGNIQNVISLDPLAMENAEVLFGSSSTIYGSDAIGGVMSFQTLKPQFSKDDQPYVKGKAMMRYSSANQENTGHFDVNVGWQKWAIVTSVSANKYGDLRQGNHGPDDYLKSYNVQRIDSVDVVVNQEDELLQSPSAYNQVNLMQKVRFAPNEKWDIEYGFHYSETSAYGRYDRHLEVKGDEPKYAEWGYGPQKWMMNQLSISNFSDNFLYDQMSIKLAHQDFVESRIDRKFNNDIRRNREENVVAYSANADFSKRIGKNNNLFYGLEYILNDVNSTGIQENIVTGDVTASASRYPQSQWQSFGAYINDEHKLTDRFTLQAGLRYTHYMLNAEFDNSFYAFPFQEAKLNNGALTGGIGGVYSINEKTVLRFNASTAFRSPNVDDIGKVFDSEPGAVVIPNPDLSAEYAYNFDLGITKVVGNVLKLDLTGYYTLLENAIVRRDYQLNGADSILYDGTLSQVQALQNAAVADVYGIQAGVEINLSKGFMLTSKFNYQMGEEEMDDGSVSPSRHAAPWFGITRLKYNYRKLSLEVNAQYQGERAHEDLSVSEQGKSDIYALDENGNTYSPSWYTVNLKAMYQFHDNFTVSGGLENITDQRYRPYSSGLSGAGRNFVLSLIANF
ncbi:TonB-dependent receptor [Brumimicrobium aurantiacum]|uniref:TonB-dependent receptor n=1 Tax=Brumimicrobium aurantiacum TaxID=1737063 RepID=A0A3E1EXC5_9FLAO|nr:TonB-dependent receptor [Brumimicrobium aurantiacum]RFC54220.1 TonB-dependent receptor [Brumimicrobium aurantiacum]